MFCLDGVDYTGDVSMITVQAGILTQEFAVPIVDDNITECNETFTVTISSVTTCGVTVGSDSSTEVRIIDDDSKW